ncbi:MAG: AMP-binding protein, partial [Casimicrobiaceae bacterium]
LQQVVARTPVRNVVVTSIGEFLAFRGRVVDLMLRRVKKMIPKWSLPGSIRLNDAMRQGSKLPLARVPIAHADLAFLQYTGGTTGVAKGAMLTHGNIVANMLQARAWVRPFLTSGEQRQVIMTPLPLYHVFSLTANCLVFMSLGGENVLITNPRDIPRFVREMRRFRFTALTGVNTLFNALLNDPRFARLDFSSLRLVLGGGMAVQEAVAMRWKEVTGVALVEAYGLTETSPAVTINPLDINDYNGTIGLPISSTWVTLRDDAGHDIPLGQSGEICIRGPQVMAGYWNRPDETANAMTADGWFMTGDIGVMNEQGYVRIIDRKKDMILVSGFNVYPNEIEGVVAEHPGVLECAAVSMPDARSGEAVKLYVVPKDPALATDDMMAFCRDRLAGYKCPREIEFRRELPKSNVGKILRRTLRDEAHAAAGVRRTTPAAAQAESGR